MNGPLPTEGSQAPKGPIGRTAMGEPQTPGRLAGALGVKGFLEEAVGSKEPEGSGPGEKDQNVRRPVTRDPTQPLCSPSLLVQSRSGPPRCSESIQLHSPPHPAPPTIVVCTLHPVPPTLHVVCTPHPASPTHHGVCPSSSSTHPPWCVPLIQLLQL